jgi:iron complex outermembrane receptor protein
MRTHIQVWKVSQCLAAAALLGGLLPAAMAANDAIDFELEEVTVTATKVQTNLQKTPMSIGVVSGDDIRQSGKSNLGQILQDVAGVEVQTAGNFGYYFWVRGIGSSPTFGQDPAVTTSINGVFQQMAQSTRGSFYDIDRVEVSRGPQSTLNGRNAMGGSVSVITAEPKLDYEASASFGTGSYDLLNGQGVLNAPFFGNRMAIRASVTAEKRDGYLSNGTSDSDLASANDTFKLILSGELQKTGGFGVGTADAGFVVPNQTATFGRGRYCRNLAECASAVITQPANVAGTAGPGFASLPTIPDFYQSFVPNQPYSRNFRSTQFYADLSWSTKWGEIWFQPTLVHSEARDFNTTFSLLTYAQWAERVLRLRPTATNPTWTTEKQDQLARGLATGINWNHLDQKQQTFELKFSSPEGSRLKWLAGLYTFSNKEKVRVSVTAGGTAGVFSTDAFGGPTPVPYCITPSSITAAAPLGAGCTTTNIPTDAVAVIPSLGTNPSLGEVNSIIRPGIDPSRKTTDQSIYGQITWPFTEQMRLTAGARYTKEEKSRDAEPSRNFYRPDDNTANPGQTNGTATAAFVTGPLVATANSWKILDYRATFERDFGERSMAYGSLSSGYRGGSFQNLPVAGSFNMRSGFSNTFNPEKLVSLEFGWRSDLFDDRLRANFSVYSYSYKDYQFNYNALVFSNQDPDALIAYTANVGNARSYGADIELRYLPTSSA